MSFYPSDDDNWDFAIIIAWFLCLLAFTMLMTGCSEARCPDPAPMPTPTVADEIRDIGYTFLRYGGLVLGLGMVIRAVLWGASILTFTGFAGASVGWIAKYLAPFVGLGAVCGGASVAFGACCVWLADYLWIVVCAGVAACMAVGWYYWPRILRWVRHRLHARSQVK